MKWRDVNYNAQYVVKRICRELGADPAEVWEIMDEEFDKEPGAPVSCQEASDLEEIVLAGLRAMAPVQSRKKDEEYLTRQEAAAALKISVTNLDRLRGMGRIAYIQRGTGSRVLIPRKAIEEYFTKGMHKAMPEYRQVNTYRKRRAV